MVTVNNWLLHVDRHEHERMKCRDPKSNDLIFGSNKDVIVVILGLSVAQKISETLSETRHDVSSMIDDVTMQSGSLGYGP